MLLPDRVFARLPGLSIFVFPDADGPKFLFTGFGCFVVAISTIVGFRRACQYMLSMDKLVCKNYKRLLRIGAKTKRGAV
ncbi:hypothetical protein DXO170_15235 [Xanthomonas oryzae pv. oryzae]|uniref:Uncharacterized protein n=1 Tax=Xanthomonas oryzae pv. oryzae TaxID=64187 RepID=A0A854CIJ6_XANOO|nr:hypothetical protein BO993_08210 [Xanthomonas oryzae pv. oryzae]OLG30937.1 hypothetical protein BXO2_19320 [Xanthomonas oryzae pv. oryzae]OLG31170.1 hypothetical protein BXO6_16055 [Xanthomonas oryzae pv. oryzae]OLG42130.1 hypothetical protein BXO8_20340 [Xanthomonas oryzae pv. oryzae]OLG42505.1 hypothetical protein BXO33_16430 [Xanthomonas oryzae pv. oryzae]